jgi:hypothetical protein
MARAAGIGAVTMLAVAIGAAGCGSSSSAGTPGTAGSTGTGGTSSAGTAGTTGSAGATGSGGASGYIPPCTALVPTAALITNFSASGFGIYDGMALSGSTFTYPAAVTGTYGTAWNVTGTIADYSGLGAGFQCGGANSTTMDPGIANLSAYQGVQFDISGTFTATGTGDGGIPATGVTFSIGTAPDDVVSQARSGFNANDATTWSYGTCVPAGSQYDGTCASPSKVITFGTTPTTVMIHWGDLTGGKPKALDPTKITNFAWAFPWNGTGSAQYSVNVTISNLTLF